jgi:hypothetical protein
MRVVVDIEEEWLHKPTKRCQTYFIDGQLAKSFMNSLAQVSKEDFPL